MLFHYSQISYQSGKPSEIRKEALLTQDSVAGAASLEGFGNST